MNTTCHRLALAGAVCLSLGLAASGAGAQDRPASHLSADGQHRREQRLHDLLQIKPAQETAFRTFLAALESSRPQRGPDRNGRALRERPGAPERLTTPERLDRMAQRIAERQRRVQNTASAVKSFYAVLSPEQRKAFDELPVLRVAGHHGPGLGGREGRGPWGGRMMHGPFQGPPPGPPR